MLRKDEVLDIVKEQVFRWFEQELLQLEFLQLSVKMTQDLIVGGGNPNQDACNVRLGIYGYIFPVFINHPPVKNLHGLNLYNEKIYAKGMFRQDYCSARVPAETVSEFNLTPLQETWGNIYTAVDSQLTPQLRQLVCRYRADFAKAPKQPAKNASDKKDKK